MRMNRRNVLVGLGGIVASGGALLGTGAFSQVEASRDVNIDTAGDSSALIGIDLTGDLAGQNGDTISFELSKDVNLDAITSFNGALTITNNRETTGDTVDIDIHDGSDNSFVTDDASGETDSGLYFEVDSMDARTGIDAGNSVTFDVVFNLEGQTTKADGDNAIPGSITIQADDSSA